jgi:transposase InsO family protein
VSAVVKRWMPELLEERRRHPRWGAGKLLRVVQRRHPRAHLPSERTVERRWKEAGLIGVRAARSKRGPRLVAVAYRLGQRPNEVWTVDLKGWFRVGVGDRCEPLTVRDLYSRMVLWVRAVPQPSEAAVRRHMEMIFRRYGLPQVIRVDNGPPFGSRYQGGALGLTRLSAWWVQLGIEVEFTRRARPQDNGGHEQMHRILKADTASPTAATLAAQERRMERWRRRYNQERPHAALGMKVPADYYRPSRRAYAPARPWTYPARWQVRRVSAKGTVRWEGRVRNVGMAFGGAQVGLVAPSGATATEGVWEVFFGRKLIGHLHRSDAGGMRAAQLVRPPPEAPSC